MKNRILYSIAIFILFMSVAEAQEYETDNDTTDLMSVTLGEIIIKASKDNVTYKTIPASVSVITSNNIMDNEIRSLDDISGTAPNFFMPDYGSKLTSPVYIRGIGSRINAPSVGLYVDYVPYFEKAAFNFDFFDITRIEVLRGPQGTLFGRNTMGGIVNIVTISPMDYNGTHLNLSSGTYGTYSVNGGHYGKLNNKFGYSLALNYLHNDGFFTNLHTGKKADELNSYGLRNRLIYEITNRLTIENIAGLELSNQGGYPYSIFNDSLNKAERVNYNQYSSYKRGLFSDAMLIRYSGSNFELVATSSYQHLNDRQNIDQDFTPSSLYFFIQKQNQNMFSQEVIVRSTGRNNYKWLLGGYAFYQAFDNELEANLYARNINYIKSYDHVINGYALFHQSTLNNFIIKDLTITGGIRIDAERDVLDYKHDNRTGDGSYVTLVDTIYPALRSLEIIPRLALNYKFNNNNFYVVMAKGYKTGGFNSSFYKEEDLFFNPEHSWNYEAGIKSSLFKNSVYTDFSIFYIDWNNQQIYQSAFYQDGSPAPGSLLKNVGKSVSKGVELSVKTAPVKGFDFALAYGYTHATFIYNVLSSTVNYNNNFLPYVPRHTVALQGGKSFTLKNSAILDNIKLGASYRGVGEIYWNERNAQKQPYYGLLDAKISFIRKSFQFDIWTKNLLNKEYSSFYFEALGNKYVQTGKPAQIGMNLSVKF